MSSTMTNEGSNSKLAGRAYILQNQVTHARFLPTASKHSFVYPTVSLLVSLNALEKKELDLVWGWLFGYGGTWGRLTGLRSSSYLHDGPTDRRSIRNKLVDVLGQRGHPGCELNDAWLLTMPSFLGFEGINPLSVYFCYKQGSPSLWIVVLEVHNTFGERHIYTLETGMNEQPPGTFDHQWTFPRQFHVSPFNDRSGYYICQVVAPPHPPSPLEDRSHLLPYPVIKITLLTGQREKKLAAILRVTHSVPLSNISLLLALVRSPFGLLLVFPRIAYHAYLLHYSKGLDVYQRPEPLASDATIESHLPAVPNAVQTDTNSMGHGIGWQKKGFLENWCEQRVYALLRSRCVEKGISVIFVPANPPNEQRIIPSDGGGDGHRLTIYYRSPKIFTILFMMPSPLHALLFGSKGNKVFSVSSEDYFNVLFEVPSPIPPGQPWRARLARCVREALVPKSLDLSIPPCHALDAPMTFTPLLVLLTLFALTTLEERLFKVVGARFVRGDEPWGGWTRLVSSDLLYPWGKLGSVQRRFV